MSQDAPIHPSATVVLLRDAPGGFETLLLQRSREIVFGGAWAFPGGRVEDEGLTEEFRNGIRDHLR